MKQFLLLIFGCFLMANTGFSQISISEDPVISSMIERHKQENRNKQSIKGWRLQLTASTDRTKVMTMKERFLDKYPHLSAEWVYKAPYYKLNVGAYKTKLEATALKHKLRYDYPNAYIMLDSNIKPHEID